MGHRKGRQINDGDGKEEGEIDGDALAKTRYLISPGAARSSKLGHVTSSPSQRQDDAMEMGVSICKPTEAKKPASSGAVSELTSPGKNM